MLRPWLLYTLVRVGLFAVLFAVLLAVTSGNWVIAAVIAALLAFCISYIFFAPLRRRVTQTLADRAQRPVVAHDADSDAEDAELDRAAPAPAPTSATRPAASGSEDERGAES